MDSKALSSMKHAIVLTLAAGLASTSAWAQVYRCGNEYTNSVRDTKEAEARGCKLVEGGNVTIIEAPRTPAPPPAVRAPSTSPNATARIDDSQQRQRDQDARMILDTELKKAEMRQAELLKEYNHGEPDKIGIEARNYQRYLDRVAALKASIARNESDIAGIKRELARLPTPR